MNVIEAKNLYYRYPDGTVGLDGVSFSIDEGETFGIVGPNGAGKTTLLLSLCGLIYPRGSLRVMGKEFTKRNVYELRKDIGLLFHNPDDQLFMSTVFEDVAFGPKNLGFTKGQIAQSVKESLEEVELSGFENRSSHHLSFGEKKRVALATILAMKPKILLLDEPTSNLDPRSRRHFIDILNRIETTKIVAGHDLEMVLAVSEKVLIINEGRIVKEGITESIFQDEPLMIDNGLEVPISLNVQRRTRDKTKSIIHAPVG